MTADLAARERELLLDEFKAIRPHAAAAIALFDEGATLPFIARYRKERTGELDEVQITSIRTSFSRLGPQRGQIVLDRGCRDSHRVSIYRRQKSARRRRATMCGEPLIVSPPKCPPMPNQIDRVRSA